MGVSECGWEPEYVRVCSCVRTFFVQMLRCVCVCVFPCICVCERALTCVLCLLHGLHKVISLKGK